MAAALSSPPPRRELGKGCEDLGRSHRPTLQELGCCFQLFPACCHQFYLLWPFLKILTYFYFYLILYIAAIFLSLSPDAPWGCGVSLPSLPGVAARAALLQRTADAGEGAGNFWVLTSLYP